MSKPKWTNDETFKFIELYQNESTIWDPKHKYHKDKVVVNEAWQRIADAMSISVSELKKKKDTLLAAFRLNHKKVQASMKSGGEEDTLKPVWIYYDVLAAFMSDVYDCRSVLSTEDEELPSVNEESSADEDQVNTYKKVQRPAKTPVQKRRCQKPVEMEETQKNTAFNKALSRTKRNERVDDCDLYARLLAYRLKSYSAVERQELMYEIDGLLLKKRKRNPTASSPSEIILSHPSSRTMNTSRPSSQNSNYSRPFSQNSNYYSSSPRALSANSPPPLNEASSSAIYISISPESPVTVKNEVDFKTEDIFSQACYDAEMYENDPIS